MAKTTNKTTRTKKTSTKIKHPSSLKTDKRRELILVVAMSEALRLLEHLEPVRPYSKKCYEEIQDLLKHCDLSVGRLHTAKLRLKEEGMTHPSLED